MFGENIHEIKTFISLMFWLILSYNSIKPKSPALYTEEFEILDFVYSDYSE